MLKLNHLIYSIAALFYCFPAAAMEKQNPTPEFVKQYLRYVLPLEIKNPEDNPEIVELVYTIHELEPEDIYRFRLTGKDYPQKVSAKRVIRKIIVPGEAVRIGHFAEIQELTIQTYGVPAEKISSGIFGPEELDSLLDRAMTGLNEIPLFSHALKSINTLNLFFSGQIFCLDIKLRQPDYVVRPSIIDIKGNVKGFGSEPFSITKAFPGLMKRGGLHDSQVSVSALGSQQARYILGLPDENSNQMSLDSNEAFHQLETRLADLYFYGGIEYDRTEQIRSIIANAFKEINKAE